MRLTIRMSATVEVRDQSAVMLAALASALGTPWAEQDNRVQAVEQALSDVRGALLELVDPAAALEGVPGLDIVSTATSWPVSALEGDA